MLRLEIYERICDTMGNVLRVKSSEELSTIVKNLSVNFYYIAQLNNK